MKKSLLNKTFTGFNWNILKTYVKFIENFIIGIILARLIEPREFGLLGMVILITGIADLVSTLGMSMSIVKLKEITQKHISVALTITLSMGVLITISFFFLSTFIADFYHQPELVKITKIISLMFIFKSVSSICYGLLLRDLNFKALFNIEIFSYTFGFGLVSIILAFNGFGVWSLVWGKVSSVTINTIYSLFVTKLKLRLTFDRKSFNDLITFGSGFSLSKIITYVSSNVDYLIVGKLLSPVDLGLYTKAFNLMTLPISRVAGSFYNVIFPTFSKIQDDKKQLKSSFIRLFKTFNFILIPIIIAMIVLADYIIIGLYGENWTGAILPFQILSFAGLFKITLGYSGALAHSTGYVFKEVRQQIIYVLLICLSMLLLYKYKLPGISASIVLGTFVLFYIQTKLSLKIIECNWIELIKTLLPTFYFSVFSLFISFLARGLIELAFKEMQYEIKLLISVAIFIPAYLSFIVFSPKRIKGDSITWIISKYNMIPQKIKKFYFSFNPGL